MMLSRYKDMQKDLPVHFVGLHTIKYTVAFAYLHQMVLSLENRMGCIIVSNLHISHTWWRNFLLLGCSHLLTAPICHCRQ